MASLRQALQSDEHFAALSEAEKTELARALASEAGPASVASPQRAGQLGYLVLTHETLGMDFVVVPGARCELGYTAADREAVARCFGPPNPRTELLRWVQEVEPSFTAAHEVELAPFMVGQWQVSSDTLARLLGRWRSPSAVAATLAEQAAAAAGCRLPTEDEWEYLARDGGHVSFVDDAEARYYHDAAWRGEALRQGVGALGRGEWTRGEQGIVRRGCFYGFGAEDFEDAVYHALVAHREPKRKRMEDQHVRLTRSL